MRRQKAPAIGPQAPSLHLYLLALLHRLKQALPIAGIGPHVQIGTAAADERLARMAKKLQQRVVDLDDARLPTQARHGDPDGRDVEDGLQLTLAGEQTASHAVQVGGEVVELQ